MNKKIGIIGGGNMGQALIAALYKKYDLIFCEKSLKVRRYLCKKYKIQFQQCKNLVEQCDIIILAVKPQDIDTVLVAIRRCKKKNLVISIAAGITTHYIEKKTIGQKRVIRAMPNLPVKMQRGVTALCQGRYATKADLRLACIIFSLLGTSVIVQERLMNAVTAVSGSGPGYVYLFAEEMIKAARSLGLPMSLAKTLVLETFLGSMMLLQQTKEDPSALRIQVSSKGGTTQAAVQVFLKNKMNVIFKQALEAAVQKAQELSRRSLCEQ